MGSKYAFLGSFFVILLFCTTYADVCNVVILTATLDTSYTSNGLLYWLFTLNITAQSNLITEIQLQVNTGVPPNGTVTEVDTLTSLGEQKYGLPSYVTSAGGLPPYSQIISTITIQSSIEPTFSIARWACGYVTHPIIRPLPQGQCNLAVVIDQAVYNRTYDSDSTLYARFNSYISDVSAFYLNYFNIEFTLEYLYIEKTSSFSAAYDADELLGDFVSAVQTGYFGPDFPTDACIYVFISGRMSPGVAGEETGTACSGAYLFANDDPGDWPDTPSNPIGRLIHEIGHALGGEHPDQYPSPPYVCSTNEINNGLRVLRASYEYIDPNLFISDCATQSIRADIPEMRCLWNNNDINFLPNVTFYDGPFETGASYWVPGIFVQSPPCYNIVNGFNDEASSVAITGSILPDFIVFFQDIDCLGNSWVYPISGPTTVNSLGAADNIISSFQLIWS